MKRKFWVISSLCLTLTLALAGLSVEKTYGSSYDSPWWSEYGEHTGEPYHYTVYCGKTIIYSERNKETDYFFGGFTQEHWGETVWVEYAATATGCRGEGVMFSACMPNMPC